MPNVTYKFPNGKIDLSVTYTKENDMWTYLFKHNDIKYSYVECISKGDTIRSRMIEKDDGMKTENLDQRNDLLVTELRKIKGEVTEDLIENAIRDFFVNLIKGVDSDSRFFALTRNDVSEDENVQRDIKLIKDKLLECFEEKVAKIKSKKSREELTDEANKKWNALDEIPTDERFTHDRSVTFAIKDVSPSLERQASDPVPVPVSQTSKASSGVAGSADSGIVGDDFDEAKSKPLKGILKRGGGVATG